MAVWSDRDKWMLGELYPAYSLPDVAAMLGRNYTTVKSAVKRFGLRSRERWSGPDVSRLRELYPHQSNQDLARLFGRTKGAIDGAGRSFGLKKSVVYLRSVGIQKGSNLGALFRFPKGNVPANKGLRRPGWSVGRMRETQFRKGERPLNWKPVGTICTDSDGYRRIKVREPRPGEPTGSGNRESWPFLHVYTWEKRHGPLPVGHVVCFKDGDRSNCALKNLERISRAELARRNAMWHRFPPELIAAITANAALKRRITTYGQEQTL